MGQPTGVNLQYPRKGRLTGGTETSQYPEEKKTKRDSPSSGERKGNSPNSERVKLLGVALWGLWEEERPNQDAARELPNQVLVEEVWKASPQRVIAP
jgi:hypothetical protein